MTISSHFSHDSAAAGAEGRMFEALGSKGLEETRWDGGFLSKDMMIFPEEKM